MRNAVASVNLQKLFGVFHQLRMVVVAGCGHSEPVGGDLKIPGALRRPRIVDSAVAQNLHNLVIHDLRSERVRHSLHRMPEHRLQIFAILDNFRRCRRNRQTVQERMVHAVHRHLVRRISIQRQCLRRSHSAMNRPRLPCRALGREQPRIEVERTLQTVRVQDINQSDILLHAVVIA